MPDSNLSAEGPEPPRLRQLRLLVTALTATMILGLLTIIILIVMALNRPAPGPVLPEDLALPEGHRLQAVTAGQGWHILVTEDAGGIGHVLVFGKDGSLAEDRLLPR